MTVVVWRPVNQLEFIVSPQKTLCCRQQQDPESHCPPPPPMLQVGARGGPHTAIRGSPLCGPLLTMPTRHGAHNTAPGAIAAFGHVVLGVRAQRGFNAEPASRTLAQHWTHAWPVSDSHARFYTHTRFSYSPPGDLTVSVHLHPWWHGVRVTLGSSRNKRPLSLLSHYFCLPFVCGFLTYVYCFIFYFFQTIVWGLVCGWFVSVCLYHVMPV